jgi:hypothetical protein
MNGIRFIIVITLLLILIFLLSFKKTNLKYVMSDIDDEYYLVRDLNDKQKAANLIARLKKNIHLIKDYLVENIDNYPEMKQYIKQLQRKLKHTVYYENEEDSIYTSYSVNKGEELVFCLRSKKNKNRLHKLNLIMYVTLHEMAHVACPETGHTPLFKKIFSFLTKIAIEKGIYKRIEFYENPREYCGLTISDSIA